MNVVDLSGNNVSSFKGGGLLPNLLYLFLSNNEFTGDFVITAEDFPTSLKFHLTLGLNKLTSFKGGGLLTNLATLGLDNNEFTGDFIITEEDFPSSIRNLYLYRNKLTGIDVEPDAVPNLIYLNVKENDGIIVSQELCSRRPDLSINPYDSCDS